MLSSLTFHSFLETNRLFILKIHSNVRHPGVRDVFAALSYSNTFNFV